MPEHDANNERETNGLREVNGANNATRDAGSAACDAGGSSARVTVYDEARAEGGSSARNAVRGKLLICPTPIGNLADMSQRALDALRFADIIYAEDTRVTGKLLASLNIVDKQLFRLDEHVMTARANGVLQAVMQGQLVVYCSDAGVPGVSDPGLRLVAAAREAGVPIEVLPGSCAATTAYVASGTTCPHFYFGAFFPRKDAARRALLQQLAPLDAALIFCESPNRLIESLKVIAEVFPVRQVAVCRELTKLHEEVVRAPAPEVLREFEARTSIKGEVMLVIDPASEDEYDCQTKDRMTIATARACELLDAGERSKVVAATIAAEQGLSRNEAYDLVLRMRDTRAAD